MANAECCSVLVRQLAGAPVALLLPPASTVAQLKQLVERKTSVPVDSQRLVYTGRELDNQRTLSFYQLVAGGEYPMTLVLRTKGMRVLVKTLKECSFVVDCDASSTVIELKYKVAEQDAQWDVQRQRIILRGKELEDGNRLSECGLDDEAPTVHLVMRLPAPGTARRKRDPAFAGKEALCGGGGAAKTPAGGFKVKTEPTDEDDLAAMSFAGIRHLSDMLVDGDQMEFEQAWHEYEQTTTAAPGWDVEAGLGPRKSTKSIGLPSPGASAQGQPQDAKLMDTADVNSFLAPCPPGPSSGTAAHSPAEADPIMLAEPVLAKEGARGIKASSCAPGPAGCMPVSPSTEVKAAVSVDIDSDVDHGALPSTQGRAYDLNKVDEKLRKRLLKNRLSAERSRQRKQAHVEHLEFELSCCRSENEHLKKKVASLEAQVAALSLNTGCKPATAFNHQELTAVS